MLNFDLVPQNLSVMLKQVNSNEGFKKFIKKVAQKMNFEKKNILNLTQQKVETLYSSLKTKSQQTQSCDELIKNFQNSIWLQNQLRIFIYIMCTHLFLKRISIHELKSEDYIFLNDFFPNKRPQHLEYQIKLLLCNKNIKWSNDQSKLFRDIMKSNQESKRWNYIAKELFIRSNKKYFKTPKQCRQRWINHEDPSKIKGNWQLEEDTILLKSVSIYGKKWTLISRELNESRTENSVKNRYNSLIKMGKKQYGFEKTQQILIELLLEKIKDQQIKQQNSIEVKLKIQQLNKINIIQEQNQKTIKKQEKQIISKINEEILVQKEEKMDHQMKPQKIITAICSYSDDHDFKYVFEQSQQLQNIIWHSSQSPFKISDQFYLMDGNLCFEQENAV